MKSGNEYTMDDDLLEDLLNSPESETLDFKSEQYKILKDKTKRKEYTENEQSKFVKDILAMTNTLRTENAYIIIGVKEENGKKFPVDNEITSIDDNNFQNLISSKLRPIPRFLYYEYNFQKKKYGVFEIKPNKNKTLSKLTNWGNPKFGIVEKNQTYIRRGSINDIATQTEIIDIESSLNKNGISFFQKFAILGVIVAGLIYVFNHFISPLFFSINSKIDKQFELQKKIHKQNNIVIILLAVLVFLVFYIILYK